MIFNPHDNLLSIEQVNRLTLISDDNITVTGRWLNTGINQDGIDMSWNRIYSSSSLRSIYTQGRGNKKRYFFH